MPYQPKPFNLEEMWTRRLQKSLQSFGIICAEGTKTTSNNEKRDG